MIYLLNLVCVQRGNCGHKRLIKLRWKPGRNSLGAWERQGTPSTEEQHMIYQVHVVNIEKL